MQNGVLEYIYIYVCVYVYIYMYVVYNIATMPGHY